MSRGQLDATETLLAHLEEATSILSDSDDVVIEYLIAEEVPSKDSVLTEQNLRAYLYSEIPLDSDALAAIQSDAAEQTEAYLESVESGTQELVEYDIGNTEQDNIPAQYVQSGDIEHPERYESLFAEDSFEQTTYDEAGDIGFQVLRITSERTGDRVLAFQRFTQRQLSSDGERLRVAMGEQQYDQFIETVVTIPARIDCIWYQDTIFVFRAKPFEEIFDFLQQYKRHANNVLTGLEDADLTLHDMEQFVDSIRSDRRALRKMQSVERRGLYDTINRVDIENVIDEFELGIEAVTENGEWGITIPDMRKKWDVIRLLNDDHVVSYLTDSQYQVYEKDER